MSDANVSLDPINVRFALHRVRNLRWPTICRMWRWTLTYQKFLLCIS